MPTKESSGELWPYTSRGAKRIRSKGKSTAVQLGRYKLAGHMTLDKRIIKAIHVKYFHLCEGQDVLEQALTLPIEKITGSDTLHCSLCFECTIPGHPEREESVNELLVAKTNKINISIFITSNQ